MKEIEEQVSKTKEESWNYMELFGKDAVVTTRKALIGVFGAGEFDAAGRFIRTKSGLLQILFTRV